MYAVVFHYKNHLEIYFPVSRFSMAKRVMEIMFYTNKAALDVDEILRFGYSLMIL